MSAIQQQNKSSEIIAKYRDDFASVLPNHVKADQWVRLASGLFRRDEKLATILARNPGSVLSALLDAARLGLDVGDTYHLVPFGNEVVGMADYTGVIELMYRAGAVTSVKAEIVRANDKFEFSPDMSRPSHTPDWFGDRGEIVGAYAYADMRDGAVSKVVVRSKAEIDKVKAVSKTSKSASSPWSQWYDRMALKTVVRELAKFVPTSAEYVREQMRAAQEVEAERRVTRINQIPAPASQPPTASAPAPAPSPETAPVAGPESEPVTGEVVYEQDGQYYDANGALITQEA